MSNKTPMPIYFTQEQIKQLKIKAKETGDSIASIVRQAVNKYLG